MKNLIRLFLSIALFLSPLSAYAGKKPKKKVSQTTTQKQGITKTQKKKNVQKCNTPITPMHLLTFSPLALSAPLIFNSHYFLGTEAPQTEQNEAVFEFGDDTNGDFKVVVEEEINLYPNLFPRNCFSSSSGF